MFCAIAGNYVKKSGDVMAGDLDMGPYCLKFIDGSQSGAIRTADGYANRLAFRKYDDLDKGSLLVYEGKFDGDINMSGLKTVDGVDVSEIVKLVNAVVFNDSINEEEVWQDLDLSTYVGANAALCFFQVYFTTSILEARFFMKPKGFGGAYADHYNGCSCCLSQIDDEEYAFLTCFTNNDGIVQIAGDQFATGGTFNIKLVGCIK